MAFDAGMLSAVTFELNNRILGSRVEKVYQPEKDEIVLLLRTSGESLKVSMSASANNPRINITFISKENPVTPPIFCIMLRKYLNGSKIIAIDQIGFERVIRITFDGKDEMGFSRKVKLYQEIMGKYSNIIFTDEFDKIIGVIRPVDFSTSQKRQVLPGMLYELPPAQNKSNPLTETYDNFVRKIDESEFDKRTDKFITDNYLGISSLNVREISFLSCDTIKENPNLIADKFFEFVNKIKDNRYNPCMIVDKDNCPTEYSFILIKQYDIDAGVVCYDSVSKLIEDYFETKDRTERARQRASDLFKTVQNAISRLEKKSEIQKAELENASKKDEYKRNGDLIIGSMYMLSRGMKSAKLIDYSDPKMSEVEIELDARLTPAENAQKWYKKYNKAKNAEIELKKQLEESSAEITYLKSELDLLERANGQSELDEIRNELSLCGYGNSKNRKKAASADKKNISKPLEFVTSGGYRVLCGKNNIQNDYIRQKIASKDDWWFHVKNAPGSHVVMLCEGNEPSESDFTEAAMIAACHSSLAEAKNIAVDYTNIRNLKKPTGAKPGFVIYHTNYSAYVTPDNNLCKRLQKMQ